MMDFMDSMRRGVDRAGFEVDRLLRANRVRSRINALRSQLDEEERQIGRRVVELHRRGVAAHEGLLENLARVEQYEEEIARREAELEAINREEPPVFQQEPPGPTALAVRSCPACAAPAPEDALFCPRCGTRLTAAPEAPQN